MKFNGEIFAGNTSTNQSANIGKIAVVNSKNPNTSCYRLLISLKDLREAIANGTIVPSDSKEEWISVLATVKNEQFSKVAPYSQETRSSYGSYGNKSTHGLGKATNTMTSEEIALANFEPEL